MTQQTEQADAKNYPVRLIAVVLTGILAGIAGMLLALILHAIQHLAFGYSIDQLVGSETFLEGVTDASHLRRVAAILGGGAVAGFGWWLLARYGKKRVSIAAAVANPAVPMLTGTTTVHAKPFGRLDFCYPIIAQTLLDNDAGGLLSQQLARAILFVGRSFSHKIRTGTHRHRLRLRPRPR